jgi:hypothetical protein
LACAYAPILIAFQFCQSTVIFFTGGTSIPAFNLLSCTLEIYLNQGMKNIATLIFIIFFGSGLRAQTGNNDVSNSVGYANQTHYSLSNGTYIFQPQNNVDIVTKNFIVNN